MAQCFNSLVDLERYVVDALGAEGAPVDGPELVAVVAGRLRMRALDLDVSWGADWAPVVDMPEAEWLVLLDGAAAEARRRWAASRGKPSGRAQCAVLEALEALEDVGGGPVELAELALSPRFGRVRSIRRPIEKLHAKRLVTFDPIAQTVALR